MKLVAATATTHVSDLEDLTETGVHGSSTLRHRPQCMPLARPRVVDSKMDQVGSLAAHLQANQVATGVLPLVTLDGTQVVQARHLAALAMAKESVAFHLVMFAKSATFLVTTLLSAPSTNNRDQRLRTPR